MPYDLFQIQHNHEPAIQLSDAGDVIHLAFAEDIVRVFNFRGRNPEDLRGGTYDEPDESRSSNSTTTMRFFFAEIPSIPAPNLFRKSIDGYDFPA